MAQSPAEPDRKPPRFPYVAALLCAACIGAAAWTWMRYSYCWDITEWTTQQHKGEKGGWPDQAYASLTGRVEYIRDYRDPEGFGVITLMWTCETGSNGDDIKVKDPTVFHLGQTASVRGRAHLGYSEQDGEAYLYWLDTYASRLHGASIAGLVVGAMGVFVFTVALRHWLNQRRAFHV